CVLRPGVAHGRAALGCALARSGRVPAALPPLRAAVAANPFDRQAARAYANALADTGAAVALRRLARSYGRLHVGAPAPVPPEGWFAQTGTDPAPIGDELASVVVLCCNEVEYTRLCLESVLRHTRQPFELVLVDNGSTDGTPDYLQDVVGRPGPARVRVVRN